MTEQNMTFTIPGELAARAISELDYLEARLIGQQPAAILDLVWAAAAADPRGIRFTPEAERSEPVVYQDGAADTKTEADLEPDPREVARVEAELDALWAWEESEEGKAEVARADRFAVFRESRAVETAALTEQWLSDYAAQYHRQLQAFQRARGNALKAEFKSQEARA